MTWSDFVANPWLVLPAAVVVGGVALALLTTLLVGAGALWVAARRRPPREGER